MLSNRGLAADEPGLHRLDGFLVKGAFTELDRERTQHRLSLKELENDGLDGRPRPIGDILSLMASYEKLESQIDEPLLVRGDIRVALTPNTRGDEAYTACFFALTYNGLALAGNMGNLVLVRPETRPALAPPKRLWDRDHILSTQLFRLGYLNSNPILARYHDGIGTRDGHAVLEPKSNVLIVTDTDAALEKLGRHIDSEILEAMGAPTPEGVVAEQEVRLPSRGSVRHSRGHPFLSAGVCSIESHPSAREPAALCGDEVLPGGGPLDERCKDFRYSSRSIDGSVRPFSSPRKPSRKDGWILTRNVP